ncbi:MULTISPECIES: cation:proton antiporter [Gordonibacter]|uniref:Sodium:proton antiporter n=1 Tax=Gordonibacter faecis TaxID=3047475 RepID=A0ABT7DJX4_9ACTN|nr:MULTISPECIES: sodium:proton antiporter [unclassified Gordonibacter]MDJ1649547.1 sodium:proton antiporter [Gordonibacter sp. KGMB12511]HIW75044.1 sodium:proton antiporter [Candidatus Gordonibacter avicola]
MEALVLALLLLAAVLVSSVIDQLVPKISSPLIQIGLGLLIALLAPAQINITLDPELFLVLFIAPLLFDEAKNVDKGALWKNRWPVVSLAIGLVIVTALIIGVVVNKLEPSIELAAAIALGAALGPTDAVAVASLSRDTDIGARNKSILEGESLINDASGIVIFQFAIAAAAGTAFSLADAAADFAVSFFGGILVGLLLSWVGKAFVQRVRSWGLENTTFHVLFEVFTPFIVFLVADALGTSGILAVVAAGLVNIISPRAIGPSISRMNIVSSSVWRVLAFALNGVVFVLLGTQLPKAMQSTWDDVSIHNAVLIGYVLLITLIYVVVRFGWIFSMERIRARRRPAAERPSWHTDVRSALVMTLGGPKGTITLAVVLTIPLYIATNEQMVGDVVASFPQRELIIFLACGVIVVTLLLATFVVPLLAPKKPATDEELRCDETQVNLEILRAVIEELAARQTAETRVATQTVIHSYNERIARIKDSNDLDDEPNTALRLRALAWEQAYVLDLIEKEEIYPIVGYQYLSRLSRVEDLLKHHAGRWTIQNAYLRLRALVRAGWHRLLSDLPGVSPTERTQAIRALQLQAAEYLVGKLQAMLTSPECDEPAEDVSALIMEYQRTITLMRNQNPSITALTRTADKTVDIVRQGLRLELEFIQTRYEEGDLCRSSAKRLRENVYLMQVDLEDNV